MIKDLIWGFRKRTTEKNNLKNIKKEGQRFSFNNPVAFLRALLHEHFFKDLTQNNSEPNEALVKSQVTTYTRGRNFRGTVEKGVTFRNCSWKLTCESSSSSSSKVKALNLELFQYSSSSTFVRFIWSERNTDVCSFPDPTAKLQTPHGNQGCIRESEEANTEPAIRSLGSNFCSSDNPRVVIHSYITHFVQGTLSGVAREI